MLDKKNQMPHTSNTCNKVPLVIISNEITFKLNDGKLADIAPTILDLMSIKLPKTMNGKSLLVR